MKSIVAITVVICALFTLSAWCETGENHQAMAELSLQEVLRLYDENREAKKAQPSPPPVAATLDRITLEGRLLNRAVELKAKVAVSVLDDKSWVSVPLLTKGESLSLNHVPTVENGTFMVDEGQLVFIARAQGRYTFELGLLLAAQVGDGSRRASLEVAEAPLTMLRLHHDDTVFELADQQRSSSEDGLVLYPQNNRFAINWKPLVEHPMSLAETPPAPPLEPVVTRAVQDVVCTLEGQCLTRVLYELRLNGNSTIVLVAPTGESFERIYRNGVAVGFDPGDEQISVEVTPFRSGDETGSLEVVLSANGGSYTLAGDLVFASPSVSWQVHELFVVLHLPDVFTYSWTGGSLQPAAAPKGVSFTHVLPTPGSTLSFHQHLVSESLPKVTMSYNIDLEGQYFRP